MQHYFKLDTLSKLFNLREISIIKQPTVKRIEHLNGCIQLEKLRLLDCSIMEISGIENCLNLKEIYLSDNKISKIQNLNELKQIEILWLDNNNIRKVKY